MARPEAGFDITARNRVQRGIDQAQNQMRGLNKTASVLTRSFAGLGGALAVGGIVRFSTKAVTELDRVAKAANTAGVAGESLQELRFAFGELAGVMEREVDTSLQRFNRRLGLAVDGTGAAQDTFGELGIAMTNAAGQVRDTEAVLNEAMRALSLIESDSTRAAKASELFGEEAGPKLAAALEGGIEAMQRTREEATGLVGEQTLNDAELLNDAFGRMASTIGGGLKEAIVGTTAELSEMVGIIDRPEVQRLEQRLEEINRMIRAGGSQAFNLTLDELRTMRREVSQELELLTGDIGSDYAAFLDELNQQAERARQGSLSPIDTEAIRDQAMSVRDEMDQMPDIDSGGDSQRARRSEEQLRADLDRIREFTMTREEVELQAHERRLEVLRRALENEQITERRFHELSIQAAKRTQERISSITTEAVSERDAFEKASAAGKVEFVSGQLAAMSAGAAQHSKEMFQLNKAAAIANAVVSTYQGAAKALEWGWPMGPIFAAAISAQGLAQVAAIKSQSFQGGGTGTTPSAAGSTATVNGTPTASNQPTRLPEQSEARDQTRLEFNFYGSINGPGGTEELIDIVADGIRDRVSNRDEVLITRESRQTQEIKSSPDVSQGAIKKTRFS